MLRGLSCSTNRNSSMSSQDRLIAVLATHPLQHPAKYTLRIANLSILGAKTPPPWESSNNHSSMEMVMVIPLAFISCRGASVILRVRCSRQKGICVRGKDSVHGC